MKPRWWRRLWVLHASAICFTPLLCLRGGRYVELKGADVDALVRPCLERAYRELDLEDEHPSLRALRMSTQQHFPGLCKFGIYRVLMRPEVFQFMLRGGAHMLPSVSRGKLLERLCRAFEVRKVLEIGTLATVYAKQLRSYVVVGANGVGF